MASGSLTFNVGAAAAPAMIGFGAGGLGAMGLHAASYEYQHDVIVAAGPGMVSSAVVGTATAPYRRVLTLLQTQHSNPRLLKKFTPPATSKYSFTWLRCLVNVVRKQGFYSLWRGNCACMCGIVPQTFGTLVLRDNIEDGMANALLPRRRPGAPLYPIASFFVSMASTCTASALIGTFTYPFVMAHTRIVADVGTTADCRHFPREFTGLFAGKRPVLATIYAKEARPTMWRSTHLPGFGAEGETSWQRGVRGIYRGLPLHIAYTVPFSCSLLFFNTVLCDVQHHKSPVHPELLNPNDFALAQLAVMAATTFAYPVQLTAIRLQMQSAQSGGPRFSTAWGCGQHVLATEGPRGFFRGMLFQLPLMPVAAVALMAYNRLTPLAAELEPEEAAVLGSVGGAALMGWVAATA